ncbi:hypothetical protein Kpol_1056p6 [Vanderwaltozyma polyspora DSM 70294]|uniref:Copper-fist domain-containing protein n=1 Tax=Vanderwaltozyma polyspora (strain ATCC 22028 / DSM 70294 / BCRC 21397 / CBS 2163 / NBRC 10782 / NRRL Y-8283 / UCD 57-17) TaxID=436907 RepID=A7TLL4_VANPO|nr:uncharacterized protein Kpol_1056p6 [Vanderwaltozyma polyspora DSM 70294]EDO16806.1 hypothetical protein Kpol_1056p6 [Vanderwaltozyma polyspora DSM 70294]
MIIYEDDKYACVSCIRGHRSTTCRHTNRMLVKVRTRGRPSAVDMRKVILVDTSSEVSSVSGSTEINHNSKGGNSAGGSGGRNSSSPISNGVTSPTTPSCGGKSMIYSSSSGSGTGSIDFPDEFGGSDMGCPGMNVQPVLFLRAKRKQNALLVNGKLKIIVENNNNNNNSNNNSTVASENHNGDSEDVEESEASKFKYVTEKEYLQKYGTDGNASITNNKISSTGKIHTHDGAHEEIDGMRLCSCREERSTNKTKPSPGATGETMGGNIHTGCCTTGSTPTAIPSTVPSVIPSISMEKTLSFTTPSASNDVQESDPISAPMLMASSSNSPGLEPTAVGFLDSLKVEDHGLGLVSNGDIRLPPPHAFAVQPSNNGHHMQQQQQQTHQFGITQDQCVVDLLTHRGLYLSSTCTCPDDNCRCVNCLVHRNENELNSYIQKSGVPLTHFGEAHLTNTMLEDCCYGCQCTPEDCQCNDCLVHGTEILSFDKLLFYGILNVPLRRKSMIKFKKTLIPSKFWWDFLKLQVPLMTEQQLESLDMLSWFENIIETYKEDLQNSSAYSSSYMPQTTSMFS